MWHLIQQLRYAAREYTTAARDRYADAIWIRGPEKTTGKPLSAFYFGSSRSFDHLMDRLYGGYATFERCEEGCSAWQARSWLTRAASDPRVDVVLADVPWPYHRLLFGIDCLHVPGWIVQKLPLPAQWDAIVAGFRKNTRSTDLRKVRKHKLEFRVVTERAAVERFYDAMYLPYTQRRFGSLAVIDDRAEIVATGSAGGLLQVQQGERVLAAVVLTKWRKSMHFLWFGLSEGLEDALLDAALSGLYLFTIQHAHQQGCNEVNFSYTLPLLNDGIYRYKRKWGAGVHAWPFGRILVRPSNLGAAVTGFLSRLPLVTYGSGGRLVGKVVVPEELTADVVAGFAERYASPGLSALEIFSMRPVDAAVRAADRSGWGPVRVVDLSAAADPVRRLCRR